jgi:hypothetical protein
MPTGEFEETHAEKRKKKLRAFERRAPPSGRLPKLLQFNL